MPAPVRSPDDALTTQEWAERAAELQELAGAVGFVDRPEVRAPLFQLYAHLRRAAALGGLDDAPFRETFGEHEVSGSWFQAARLAQREPELLVDLRDDAVAHEVRGYPGLYVCDGSAVSANPGVNPSLTITAMRERAMAGIPAR